jgi:hypothetical protein
MYTAVVALALAIRDRFPTVQEPKGIHGRPEGTLWIARHSDQPMVRLGQDGLCLKNSRLWFKLNFTSVMSAAGTLVKCLS